MKIKYLLRKIIYGLMGFHYKEDDNGYFISNGSHDFGVSFRPTSPEPEDD